MKLKVLVKEKIADAGIELLRQDYDVDIGFDWDRERMLEKIGEYDALIVRSATQVDAEVIERAAKMKIVGRAGIGVDNVDVEAATKRGIVVANAPQSNIISAAEHTIALLLAQCRQIPQANESLKACKWERSKFQGVEVYDKTLGIIGLGRIGVLVAQRAQGLGMKLIGYDPYVSKERFAQLGIDRADKLESLLAVSDFLTVHLPKTAETIGMFGPKEFAAMKDGIRLVNTARGGIYDENTLVEALKSGKVASMGVDVYPQEPCTDSPLFAFDQVVATPHLGASTAEAQDKAGTMIAEQVAAALKGEFVSNAVNIAPIPPDVAEALQPFIPLCRQLGKALVQMAEGQLETLEIEYYGHIAEMDRRLLTSAVIVGGFESLSSEPVNFVNAMLVAEERGLTIKESSQSATKDYVNLITVRSRSNSHEISLAGTLIGKRDEPRFVRMYDFEIDMAPSKHMAFFRYKDVPGMIGRIGTILGRENINIASMQVGRKKIHGEAVMGVNVDSPIPDDVLQELIDQAGIAHARAIVL
jgi:D-3-phosphoglycerate dehydrogenase / 2-oxoglutarate reductase